MVGSRHLASPRVSVLEAGACTHSNICTVEVLCTTSILGRRPKNWESVTWLDVSRNILIQPSNTLPALTVLCMGSTGNVQSLDDARIKKSVLTQATFEHG